MTYTYQFCVCLVMFIARPIDSGRQNLRKIEKSKKSGFLNENEKLAANFG